MVGLHGLIVLYLKRDQYRLIAPLDDFRRAITAACINSNCSYTDKAILNHLADAQTTIFSQSFFLRIRTSSVVVRVLKRLAGLSGTFQF